MSDGGRVAVVTGAASGMGLGIARDLAARGHRVALFDLDGAAADSVAADSVATDLRATGAQAVGIVVAIAGYAPARPRPEARGERSEA
ncbi:SDR family NAD(P)-dependent oxidoreductase [Blastococcus sp. TF02A-26]|uniref:SDR family NAD(P)-dependent oxidoreductase n=1 Tax=Blastococcus sp. TF02A-26 TaxID=2250577 RepID=UPI0018F2BD65|nr:SDR family NAD(P)-dependent oxidoreductase [Blastococcus sp. TF02A-26]